MMNLKNSKFYLFFLLSINNINIYSTEIGTGKDIDTIFQERPEIAKVVEEEIALFPKILSDCINAREIYDLTEDFIEMLEEILEETSKKNKKLKKSVKKSNAAEEFYEEEFYESDTDFEIYKILRATDVFITTHSKKLLKKMTINVRAKDKIKQFFIQSIINLMWKEIKSRNAIEIANKIIKKMNNPTINKRLENSTLFKFYDPTFNAFLKKCENSNCEKEEGLKYCGGCGLVRYCSPECSKADWKKHKPNCKKKAKADAGDSKSSAEEAEEVSQQKFESPMRPSFENGDEPVSEPRVEPVD